MRIIRISVVGLAVVGIGAGCTWVRSTPAADAIRIVPPDRVADCRRLGTVSGFTKADLAGIRRSPEKVRLEVETLARREAVDLRADTLVAQGPLLEGRQSFIAFRCLE